MEIHHLKMYFLLEMVIFQCHVSFRRCICSDCHCNDASGPVETEGWFGLPTKDLTILVVTATGRRMYPTHILWKNDIPIEGRIPPGQKSCFKRTIPRIETLWLSSLFPFQFHSSHFVWPNQEIHVCLPKTLTRFYCFGFSKKSEELLSWRCYW